MLWKNIVKSLKMVYLFSEVKYAVKNLTQLHIFTSGSRLLKLISTG